MAKLTAAQRKALPRSKFALPSKRAYPIPDIGHARVALRESARSSTVDSPATVRRAVLAKFPSLRGKGPGKGKR